MILTCADSDADATRAARPVPRGPRHRGAGAGIEEAFMALTADDNDDELSRTDPMTSTVYVRYEVLRNFRNWRFLFLALAFPLVLYFIIGTANRHVHFNGTQLPALLHGRHGHAGHDGRASSGSAAIIAAERSSGWTRQMRITPLRHRRVLRREGAQRLPQGAADHRADVPGRDRARGTAVGRRVADRDRPAAGRPRPVHRARHPARAPDRPRFKRARGGRHRHPVRPAWRCVRVPDRDIRPDIRSSRRSPRTGWFRRGRPRSAGTTGRPRDGS